MGRWDRPTPIRVKTLGHFVGTGFTFPVLTWKCFRVCRWWGKSLTLWRAWGSTSLVHWPKLQKPDPATERTQGTSTGPRGTESFQPQLQSLDTARWISSLFVTREKKTGPSPNLLKRTPCKLPLWTPQKKLPGGIFSNSKFPQQTKLSCLQGIAQNPLSIKKFQFETPHGDLSWQTKMFRFVGMKASALIRESTNAVPLRMESYGTTLLCQEREGCTPWAWLSPSPTHLQSTLVRDVTSTIPPSPNGLSQYQSSCQRTTLAENPSCGIALLQTHLENFISRKQQNPDEMLYTCLNEHR